MASTESPPALAMDIAEAGAATLVSEDFARKRQRPSLGINDLPEALLLQILRRVSASGGRFGHALVNKEWHQHSVASLAKFVAKGDNKLSEGDLLSVAEPFTDVSALVLREGSVTELGSGFLAAATQKWKFLKSLRLENTPIDLNAPVPPESSRKIVDLSVEQSSPRAHGPLTERLDWLLRFSNLRSLHLGVGRTHAILPNDFGAKLPRLRRLSLSGFLLWEAESFASFRTLEYFSLSSEREELPDNFFSALTPTVSTLKLQCPYLLTLPSGLRAHTQLRHLDIRQSIWRARDLRQPEAASNGVAGEILALTRLETLSFSGPCMDHGPPGGSLPNLRTLKLHGLKQARLPAWVCRLALLTSLEISDTGLTSIPDAVSSLSILRHLRLHENGNVRELPHSLASLTNLEALYIEDCYALAAIPPVLSSLQRLKSVSISNCPGLTALPEAIWSLSSLRKLTITGCPRIRKNSAHPITGDGSGTPSTSMPQDLAGLRQLECLVLDCAAMRDFSVGPDFSTCPWLRTLKVKCLDRFDSPLYINGRYGDRTRMPVARDHMKCEGSGSLPMSMGGISSLTDLNISCKSLLQLPASITCLENLKSLHLHGCDGILEVPTLETMSSLEVLEIHHCDNMQVNGEQSRSRQATKSRMKSSSSAHKKVELKRGDSCAFPKLHTLNLKHCRYLDEIPCAWRDARSLRRLSITHCWNMRSCEFSAECLGGVRDMVLDCWSLCLIPDLPPGSALETLRARCSEPARAQVPGKVVEYGHRHRERLPLSLSSLSRLRVLRLPMAYTHLPRDLLDAPSLDSVSRSLLETHIENLQRVERLRLERLPPSFGSLGGLRTLEISASHGSDHSKDLHVQGVSALTKLERLEVEGCEVKDLPRGFTELPSLTRLSFKRVSAELLSLLGSFAHLKHLTLLSVSCLNELPDAVYSMPLESLSADGRLLSNLPDTPTALSRSLTKLTVGEDVPSSLRKWPGIQLLPRLKVLTISHLPGKIPHLGFLTVLKELEELHFRFCDGVSTIPESLGLVKSLKVVTVEWCQNFRRLPESVAKLTLLQRIEVAGIGLLKLPSCIAAVVGTTHTFSGWKWSPPKEGIQLDLWRAAIARYE